MSTCRNFPEAIRLRQRNFQARGELRLIDGCIDESRRIFNAQVVSIFYCNTDIRNCKNSIRRVIERTAEPGSVSSCSHGTSVASIIAAKEDVVLDLTFLRTALPNLVTSSSDSVNYCGISPILDKIVVFPLNKANSVSEATTYFKDIVFTKTDITDTRGNKIVEDFAETVVLSSVSGSSDLNFWEEAQNFCNSNDFLYVTAAGNDGLNFNSLSQSEISQQNSACLPPPTSCMYDLVICVGTYYKDQNNSRIIAGNYGNNYIDIVAMTGSMHVVMPGATAGYANSKYDPATSFAAPQITAAITYMKTCKPNAQASEIREAIIRYSVIDDSLKDKVIDGRVFDLVGTVENFCNTNSEL